MAVKYLVLDGEFEGYTLYYHDPVLPDGPNWVLEDDAGLVFADDTWPYELCDPYMPDDDINYIERLAAYCDDCFKKRLGEVCADPEYTMGAEASGLARTWGWIKEEEKVAG